MNVVNERILFEHLKAIFPREYIQTNVKKIVNVKYPHSNDYMQFDLWVPNLNLCFEFQDSYHYETTWYHHNTQEFIHQKDETKSRMARQLGATLITVPCWWKGDITSLRSVIYFQRPDITQLDGGQEEPIRLNPSSSFFKGQEIPGVGELMLASLLHNPGDTVDISNAWWVGEKYDGIRCCWNASLREPFLRNGNTFSLPKYSPMLPVVSMDMELWLGRGQYSNAYQAISDATQNDLTTMLRMVAFDVPSQNHQQLPFEMRYKLLLSNLDASHPFIAVATRMLGTDDEHTATLLNTTIASGGEGLIMRKSGSLYEQGRSLSLIKLKTLLRDREGVVVSVGLDKSVVLKLPTGQTVSVPPHNVHIGTPHTGEIVTFTSEINSRHAVPSHPVITRIRSDLSWEDVVHSFFSEQQSAEAHVAPSNDSILLTHSDMRIFLESFARSRNMDPFLPETWYKLATDLRHSQSGRAIVVKFKGYSRAMHSLFPELTFDKDTFNRVFWSNMENRKKFFEKYAEQRNFDPLVPANWYGQLKKNILSAKGALRAISYHRNSVARALLDLFPNIGLERRKLLVRPSTLWRNPANHKLFFEAYAKEHKFDPLLPLEWYRQTKSRIMSSKNARKVLSFYNNNVSKAIMLLFPNIGLEKHKLFSHNSWYSPESRRHFFHQFAQNNGFDALHPSAWHPHTQSKQKILATRGARRVLSFHRNSVSRALVELFPNIGFERAKFHQPLRTK